MYDIIAKMGDKYVKSSGARATKKTERSCNKYWCPGPGVSCGVGCMIPKTGRSLKKTKVTRKNFLKTDLSDN
jgi:hypothetical protein